MARPDLYPGSVQAGQDSVARAVEHDSAAPPDLRALIEGRSSDTHFYCCGPAAMLGAFEAACRDLGHGHVHIERFKAAVDVAAAQAGGYRAELARSGKTIDVPLGATLLDALIAAGVDADYSCREGICGACETGMLEGKPEHHDSVLTERERASNKTMMVCVSGCKGDRLVLDI